MKRLWERIKDEPVLGWQLIAAALSLAGSFGLELRAEQTAAVFGACQVLAALAGRQLVSPTRKVRRESRRRPAELDPRLLRGDRRGR